MCNFLLFPPFPVFHCFYSRQLAKGGYFVFIEKRGRWAGRTDGWFAFLHSCNYKLVVGNKKWRSNGRVLRNDGLFLSQSEAIEDEDFLQRHQNYERREKLRRSCWDQDRRHRIRSVYSLVYCKAVLLHIYFSVHIFSFFPPQVIQEKLLFCICERPSCSRRSPTCTFSSYLHPDLQYFWRFIRSQCGWKRGKTCLVEKNSIKSFYQACIHVFLSYVANATMEETYVPPDWWRWGNFEAWWR